MPVPAVASHVLPASVSATTAPIDTTVPPGTLAAAAAVTQAQMDALMKAFQNASTTQFITSVPTRARGGNGYDPQALATQIDENVTGLQKGMHAVVGGTHSAFDAYTLDLSPCVTRGSCRIAPEDYVALKNAGFTDIIDLRLEGPHDWEQGAAQAGLTSTWIPFLDDTPPSDEQVKQFLDTVQAVEKREPAPGRVFFHCVAGRGRTGVMAACYRMACQGVNPERALAEALQLAGGEAHIMPDQQAFIQAYGGKLLRGEVPGYPVKEISGA